MAPTPSQILLANLRAYILDRPFICTQCRKARFSQSQQVRIARETLPRGQEPIIPLRKRLKDEARVRKLSLGDSESVTASSIAQEHSAITPAVLSEYELTVGLELHVELSTPYKLFSSATTSRSLSSPPNSHVAPFDLALPGAQPQFQKATLLPAIRAALALKCDVQSRSSWDRKHYFWWDQPEGYQITQYYEPFALNGHLTLYPSDLSPSPCAQASQEGPITIPLKQIQLEQDTAKTILQPPRTHLLDFNRVSHPLIEIITLPTIHSPTVAAAFVKKVQGILKAVGACERGMEMGGLRVDVNVSVRRHADRRGASPLTDNGEAAPTPSTHSYAGYTNLGQRTEIKNLSSIAAVADAITAERNRQIRILSRGGVVEGETRGWTLGAASTHRIRGKEGEVDYRYMPDPDLPALVVAEKLVKWVRAGLPKLPEELVRVLEELWGVRGKDARTLVELDDGERAEWWFCTVERILESLLRETTGPERVRERVDAMMDEGGELTEGEMETKTKVGRLASNWVLHEMGALLRSEDKIFDQAIIEAETLASILVLLFKEQITLPTAKSLLGLAFEGTLDRGVEAYVDEHGLRLAAMSEDEYYVLATQLINGNVKMAEQVRKDIAMSAREATDESREEEDDGSKKRRKGSSGGKMMWFVGQMVRKGEPGRIQPERAEKAVKRVLLEQQ